MAEQSVAEWKGCEGWRENDLDDPSDYARACRNGANWLNLIPSAQGDIVVFGGDVGSVAWIQTSRTEGVFVQWIGCDGDAAVIEMLEQNALGKVEHAGKLESIALETGPSGCIVLFDASAHGLELGSETIETITLQPGHYLLRAYYVETKTCMAVVRELSRLD